MRTLLKTYVKVWNPVLLSHRLDVTTCVTFWCVAAKGMGLNCYISWLPHRCDVKAKSDECFVTTAGKMSYDMDAA